MTFGVYTSVDVPSKLKKYKEFEREAVDAEDLGADARDVEAEPETLLSEIVEGAA